MSTELLLHGRRVRSVFELLGTKENDVTFSIGWALCQSRQFCAAFLRRIFQSLQALEVDMVSLQERRKDSGITDIEILGRDVHAIVEAKRGWALPTLQQLQLYAPRIARSGRAQSALVAMSECSGEYASQRLPREINGVRVHHVSWRDAQALTRITAGTHAEKRLMNDLRVYLENVVKMQRQESNFVFVVSLAAGTPEWSKLGWREIVLQRNQYFHPDGKGWPKEPPNYLGFRYDARLQSIHHVEGCEKIGDMNSKIPEIRPGAIVDHFLYKLGPAIKPPRPVRTGSLFRSGRVWAALDLLLTCDDIAEAARQTRMRRGEANAVRPDDVD